MRLGRGGLEPGPARCGTLWPSLVPLLVRNSPLRELWEPGETPSLQCGLLFSVREFSAHSMVTTAFSYAIVAKSYCFPFLTRFYHLPKMDFSTWCGVSCTEFLYASVGVKNHFFFSRVSRSTQLRLAQLPSFAVARHSVGQRTSDAASGSELRVMPRLRHLSLR